MMDLDHFKQVNDNWGHAAGDAALQQIGRLLPPLLRGFDLFGRVGGEEFVLALPRTQPADALQVIERCRAAIETSPVLLEDGRLLNITSRFGICVVERSEEHTSELQSLMRISYAVFCLQNRRRRYN